MRGLRVAILTISDRSSSGQRDDSSGPALAQRIQQLGWIVTKTDIVPDEVYRITEILIKWSDHEDADIILTTGGTGFSPRDVTPEATLQVIDRNAPGLAEAMRAKSLAITPHAMLSRGVTGIRKRTLIINLPGSPKGALENLDVVLPILPHAVELIQEDPGFEQGHQFIR